MVFAWLVPLLPSATTHPAPVMPPFVLGHVVAQAVVAVVPTVRDHRVRTSGM
ncbi:hypothetical protein [Pseudonocardia alni]|uniref:hypothetical protein n=1 Tax=Pseudonocardia alni TaxID=33907 RepID=UPI0033F99AA5